MKCFVSGLIFFLILSGVLPCQAQTADLTGKVFRAGTSQSVANVVVQLYSVQDSAFVTGVYTDIHGNF